MTSDAKIPEYFQYEQIPHDAQIAGWAAIVC